MFGREASSVSWGPTAQGKPRCSTRLAAPTRSHPGRFSMAARTSQRQSHTKFAGIGMGPTYQIPQTMEGMTVLENILIGALCHRSRVSDAMERAKEISQFCDLADYNNAPAETLNVVQKKRLEIARALAGDPKLLLLDETMAGLNSTEQQNAIELVKKINEKGVTILMIEHVMKVVMGVSEKVVVIVSEKTDGRYSPRGCNQPGGHQRISGRWTQCWLLKILWPGTQKYPRYTMSLSMWKKARSLRSLAQMAPENHHAAGNYQSYPPLFQYD